MDRMVAHTGFLIFARHQEQIDALDAYKYMGTRERKQESARRERLGLPPLRGETGGEAGDDFIDEPDGSCED
jgi:tRNA (adenine57-N1/adenine58-N1)-methyltransferase